MPLAVDQARVQVLEAAPVTAHDDQMHAAGVRDFEVAHALAVFVADREAQLRRVAPGQLVTGEIERQTAIAHGQAADGPGRVVGAVAGRLAAVGHGAGDRRVALRGRRRCARLVAVGRRRRVRFALLRLGGGALAVRADRVTHRGCHPEDHRQQREEPRQLERSTHAGSAS